MNISRRNFMKIAGLSAAAVAGTALFTVCHSFMQLWDAGIFRVPFCFAGYAKEKRPCA